MFVTAIFWFGLDFFNCGVALKELESVFEKEVFTKAIDEIGLTSFSHQLLRSQVLTSCNLGQSATNLVVRHGDVFFLGDFAQDEADFDVLASLLACGVDDLTLSFEKSLLIHALAHCVASNVVRTALSFALNEFFWQFEFKLFSKVLNDLGSLGVFASLSAALLNDFLHFVTELFHIPIFVQLLSEFVIYFRKLTLFHLLSGGGEGDFFTAKGFCEEVICESDFDFASFVFLDTHQSGEEAREEGFVFRQLEPVAFDLLQESRSVSSGFFCRFAVDATCSVEDDEIIESSFALDVVESGETLGEVEQVVVDIGVAHVNFSKLDWESLVFRKLELRNGANFENVGATFIADVEIFYVEQVEDLDVIAFQSSLITLTNQSVLKLFCDFTIEFFSDDGLRSFARAEARKFGLLGVTLGDGAASILYIARWDLDTNGGAAARLGFDSDVHGFRK